MRFLWLLMLVFCVCYGKMEAQTPGGNFATHNDSVIMVKLAEVDITSERKWENDTARYRYNQMKHYVKIVMPYVIAGTKLFNELDAKINDPNVSKRERKAFVNTKEDELRTQFENEVNKLNETQGVLLVKLIARQTGVNIYSMLDEFKNPFTAMKWQAWARLHGFNLNKQYEPNGEPMLEHIMESLGYPLPAVYGTRETPLVLKTN